jgi:hypothetical protein
MFSLVIPDAVNGELIGGEDAMEANTKTGCVTESLNVLWTLQENILFC